MHKIILSSSLLRGKVAKGFVHDSLGPGHGDAVRHLETARENMKGFMFNIMWNLLMHGGIMQDCKIARCMISTGSRSAEVEGSLDDKMVASTVARASNSGRILHKRMRRMNDVLGATSSDHCPGCEWKEDRSGKRCASPRLI
jgi:hypothetical protein